MQTRQIGAAESCDSLRTSAGCAPDYAGSVCACRSSAPLNLGLRVLWYRAAPARFTTKPRSYRSSLRRVLVSPYTPHLACSAEFLGRFQVFIIWLPFYLCVGGEFRRVWFLLAKTRESRPRGAGLLRYRGAARGGRRAIERSGYATTDVRTWRGGEIAPLTSSSTCTQNTHVSPMESVPRMPSRLATL